ncbi:MAG: acyl carrier protein [Bdellovibrionales bacterium]|nr:acyl carrier protein [Bdellovibrionales bacterium]
MSQEEILSILREVVTERIAKASPGDAQELSKLRTIVNKDVTPDSPLSALGWDSLQMTWLLVAIEERLDIDTSSVSLFDLYSVGDFLSEIQLLTADKKMKA